MTHFSVLATCTGSLAASCRIHRHREPRESNRLAGFEVVEVGNSRIQLSKLLDRAAVILSHASKNYLAQRLAGLHYDRIDLSNVA